MNELIRIIKSNNQNLVDGRELYEFLEINTHFKDWIKRMLEYGFLEDQDYTMLKNEQSEFSEVDSRFIKDKIDYILKIEMAKEF